MGFYPDSFAPPRPEHWAGVLLEGSGSLSTLLFLLLGCLAHDIKVAISAWFSVEPQERS